MKPLKNSIFLVSAFLITFFFGPLTLAHSPEPDSKTCQTNLKRIVKLGNLEIEEGYEKIFNRARNHQVSQSRFSLFGIFYPIRDPVRLFLRRWHNHPYTVLGIDELPFASGLIRNAFGLLSAKEKETLDPSALEKRLTDLISFANGFPSRVDELSLEAANVFLALRDLSEALYRLDSREVGITRFVSKIFFDPSTGTTRIEKIERYFGGIVALKIEVARLSQRADLIVKEAKKNAFDQALTLKNLEIYLHEFREHLTDFPKDSPVLQTEEYKKLFAQITAIEKLYENIRTLTVKEDFRPATAALQKLRWKEFWFEISSIYFKDVPHLVEKTRIKEIIEKIKEMPEEERRALNLNKVAEHLSYFRRSKWGPIIFSTLIPTAPLTWKTVYDFWFSESIARQKCAIADSEREYLECAYDFLKTKFSHRLLLSDKDLSKILTENGEVADPEIRAEIAELKRLRHEYNLEKNFMKSLEEPIKISLGEGDKLSETFREKLITTTDETWLKIALLGSELESGYLETRYLLAMKTPNIRKIVEAAIGALTDDDREKELQLLSNISLARIMAEDLRSLYKKRKSYQDTGFYYPDQFSWRRPFANDKTGR